DPGGKGQGVGVAFVLESAAPAPDPAPAPAAARRTRAAPADAAPLRPIAPALQRPLPAAEVSGLRPALPPDPSAPLDMQPIDAVPVAARQAIDSQGPGAVSASHG